ncbi:MAG: (2Fe-2S)-binding protein [Bacteroidetes bacterium QS_1_63_11]|nr:MAG: (2Fe-2S)-binding protein [Bacteroidetes bacterium QS_1_63_11]
MNIDRCHCYDQTFAHLRDVAENTGASSIDELQAHVTFGENCQLCHPYVRRMFETGQTVFEEVIDEGESDAA